jgi:hypothetical protein
MRTLCIGDPKQPEVTTDFLEIQGWGKGFRLPNGEIFYCKDDLVGFFNEKTNHFVTCKDNGKFMDYIDEFHHREQEAIDSRKDSACD